MRAIEHEVLVVGSGLAGLVAACRLIEGGIGDIGIVSAGYGGTPYIAAFNAVIENNPFGDNPMWYCEDMLKAGYHLGDRLLIETFGEYTFDCVKLLERWGVEFAHTEDGNYVLRHASGSRCPRSLCRKDMLIGQHIKEKLVHGLKEKKISIYEKTFCVEMLIDNGSISGIGALKKEDAEPVAFYAPDVIAAWGGIGNLFSESTYPADIDGRSLAMAYNAGVHLVDLEFVEFEPLVCLGPSTARGEPCPTAMLGEGAYLLNNKGERFLLKTRPQGEAGSPKSLINHAIFNEVRTGRGSPAGGVFVDLRHIDITVLKSYPWFYNRIINAGVDPKKDILEVGPIAHSYSGGMAIDKNAMTNITGLYAVGEAAGGMHGACRMAGNAATQAAVTAFTAANGILSKKRTTLNKIQPSVFLKDQGIQKDYIFVIRETVTKYLNRERNAEGLKKAIRRFETIMEMVKIDTITSQLTLSALLIAKAALERDESRGVHYRSDFPEQRVENCYSIQFTKGMPVEKIKR